MGGAQTPDMVNNAITQHLIYAKAQPGYGNASSNLAEAALEAAIRLPAALTKCPENATGDHVVFGASSSKNLTNLAVAMENTSQSQSGGVIFEANDEIVLCAVDHNANQSPWIHLATRLNLKIRWWLPDPTSSCPFSLSLTPSSILPLINANTRLVAFTACSNALGHLVDVGEVVRIVKEQSGGRAVTIVDTVAASSHARVEMYKWGCDVTLISYYKLFGDPDGPVLAVRKYELPLSNNAL